MQIRNKIFKPIEIKSEKSFSQKLQTDNNPEKKKNSKSHEICKKKFAF